MLVKVAGTPMENAEDIDPFDFIRMLAVAVGEEIGRAHV